MRKYYEVTTVTNKFIMGVDLTQASAPINWIDDDTWEERTSHFQTADAQHRVRKAASLLATWFAGGKEDKVISVEYADPKAIGDDEVIDIHKPNWGLKKKR